MTCRAQHGLKNYVPRSGNDPFESQMMRERWQKIEQLVHDALECEDTDNYDVSPDGQRFLMLKPREQA